MLIKTKEIVQTNLGLCSKGQLQLRFFTCYSQILDTLSATSKNGSTPLPLLASVDFSFVKEPQPTEALVHFIKTHPLLSSLGLKKGTIDDALQPALIHLHELKHRNMTLSHPFTVTYPKLQQLYLFVDSIKKSTYLSIATAMPNLQLLDIKTTGHVSNSCSKEIIHRCTQLTFFDVTYHHPASTHRLIAGMNARKTLYKRHMDRIRNNTEKMDTND